VYGALPLTTDANGLKLVIAEFCCTTTEVVAPAVAVIYGIAKLIPLPIEMPAPIFIPIGGAMIVALRLILYLADLAV
jgi:hypothetical protein